MDLPQEFLTVPIAHRGLHSSGVPENSMAAFQAAIDAGYGIELDLQPAADGTAMVFHDYDLMRLAQSESYIADLSLDDLAAIRLDGTDEGIPTLEDLLRLVAGRVPLLIEIKDQDGRLGRNTGDLHDRVATMLKKYEGPVAVMSFNPNTMADFAKAAPDLPRGLTTCGFDRDDWPMLDDETLKNLRNIVDFDRVGAQFISHHWKDLDNPRVAELRDAGVPILCWTITSKAQEDAARRQATNITFENYHP